MQVIGSCGGGGGGGGGGAVLGHFLVWELTLYMKRPFEMKFGIQVHSSLK